MCTFFYVYCYLLTHTVYVILASRAGNNKWLLLFVTFPSLSKLQGHLKKKVATCQLSQITLPMFTNVQTYKNIYKKTRQQTPLSINEANRTDLEIKNIYNSRTTPNSETRNGGYKISLKCSYNIPYKCQTRWIDPFKNVNMDINNNTTVYFK